MGNAESVENEEGAWFDHAHTLCGSGKDCCTSGRMTSKEEMHMMQQKARCTGFEVVDSTKRNERGADGKRSHGGGLGTSRWTPVTSDLQSFHTQLPASDARSTKLGKKTRAAEAAAVEELPLSAHQENTNSQAVQSTAQRQATKAAFRARAASTAAQQMCWTEQSTSNWWQPRESTLNAPQATLSVEFEKASPSQMLHFSSLVEQKRSTKSQVARQGAGTVNSPRTPRTPRSKKVEGTEEPPKFLKADEEATIKSPRLLVFTLPILGELGFEEMQRQRAVRLPSTDDAVSTPRNRVHFAG